MTCPAFGTIAPAPVSRDRSQNAFGMMMGIFTGLSTAHCFSPLEGKPRRSGVEAKKGRARTSKCLTVGGPSHKPARRRATAWLRGSYPPRCRAWAEENIATLCIFNALFRSKQRNGRIDPIHHDRVADFTCRRSAIARGHFSHLIDCPAMGAGESGDIQLSCSSSHRLSAQWCRCDESSSARGECHIVGPLRLAGIRARR